MDLAETLLTFDDGRVEAGGDVETFTLNERKKAVLDVMSSDPVTETAIKELLGSSQPGMTSKAVRALFEEGALQRNGRGKKGDPFLYCKPSDFSSEVLPDEIYFPPEVHA